MITRILKETYQGFQALDLNDEMFKKRVVFFNGEVNPDSAVELITQLLTLEADAPGEPITLCINSCGGCVDSGLAICDTIRGLSSPVNTVCMGLTASMGAVIFLQGAQRTMLPHSRFMIHDPSYGGGDLAGRKPLTLQEDFENLMAVRQELAELISERTGQSIEAVLEKTKNDCYMTAKEALEFGAATKIGVFKLPDTNTKENA